MIEVLRGAVFLVVCVMLPSGLTVWGFNRAWDWFVGGPLRHFHETHR